jgi:hypothetical protein
MMGHNKLLTLVSCLIWTLLILKCSKPDLDASTSWDPFGGDHHIQAKDLGLNLPSQRRFWKEMQVKKYLNQFHRLLSMV